MEQQYQSFRIKINEVWFRAGKRGQLGFAYPSPIWGKCCKDKEVRSLLMLVTDCMKVQCFICVYDPEARFPACSFTCVSSTVHYWGTRRLMSYCSSVRNKAPQIKIKAAYELCSGLMTAWGLKENTWNPTPPSKRRQAAEKQTEERGRGGRREESEDRGVTWSNAEACEEGQLSSQPLEMVNLWTQKTWGNMATAHSLFIIGRGLRNSSKTK